MAALVVGDTRRSATRIGDLGLGAPSRSSRLSNDVRSNCIILEVIVPGTIGAI